LSKIFRGQNFRGGEGQKVAKTDETTGISQLLGLCAPDSPIVYACDGNCPS